MAAHEVFDLATLLSGSCESAYAVEMLALAVEEAAFDEDVQNWMCGEAAIDFVAAAGVYLDAFSARRAEKGES